MSNPNETEQGGAEDRDEVLGLDAGPGVGRSLLTSLSPNAVVAYRGEPTASERAMVCWELSEHERREFASGIERISNELRRMDDDDIDRLVEQLEDETVAAGLDIDLRSEDFPGSQDVLDSPQPDPATAANNSLGARMNAVVANIVSRLFAGRVGRSVTN